ncbi:MAG: hypothetical protein JW881_04335, partial [Spirochaetales bacterium]|nr:hypothetical protein [Spirochaetales bacterium]
EISMIALVFVVRVAGTTAVYRYARYTAAPESESRANAQKGHRGTREISRTPYLETTANPDISQLQEFILKCLLSVYYKVTYILKPVFGAFLKKQT